MNKLSLILVFLCLRCFAGSEFEQEDIGISFEFEDTMIFDFDPHSMRKTQIFLGGEHVGGFVISVIPEGLSIAEFMSAGEEWYRGKYQGANVKISTKRNDTGIEYYRITAEFELAGVSQLEEKFIFIKERGMGMTKTGLMTYTFTYLYPTAETETAMKSLFTPIRTLVFLENKSHFNAAVKRASGL